MSENRPIISNRDKTLSVSVFERKKQDENGNTVTSYGFSAQRAFKDRDTNEWQRKEISMFPEEALRLANLLQKTYSDTLTYVEMNRVKTAEHPQASMSAPADLPDDDIPFA